uniref:Uncharacterized protein n=1 Tax=Anguilla anguilla TaxID=7936 RepID=A0A0E9WJZ8_ANGAN
MCQKCLSVTVSLNIKRFLKNLSTVCKDQLELIMPHSTGLA